MQPPTRPTGGTSLSWQHVFVASPKKELPFLTRVVAAQVSGQIYVQLNEMFQGNAMEVASNEDSFA
jgi:hypothetical protein